MSISKRGESMRENFSIEESLKKYTDNMMRQRELDDLLMTQDSKQEWIACLQNRSVEIQRMFVENGKLIEELEEWLHLPLDEETASVLYEESYKMYFGGYDDCQILLPMLYKLIPYYEEQKDSCKLMFLYGAVFYEENEIQNRREGRKKLDETYNLKVLGYKEAYTDGMDFVSRRRLWGAYYNLIVSGLGNNALSADEAFYYYKEAMEFWNTPKVQELDGDNEDIVNLVNRISREWLIVEDIIDEASEETRNVFCQVARKTFEEDLKQYKDVFHISHTVYAAYLHAKMLQGEISLDEMVDIYFAYFLEKIKDCPEAKDMTDEDLYFLIHVPSALESWIRLGVNEEKSRYIMGVLKKHTQETWYDKLVKYGSPFVNSVMSEWCFKLLKYMDTLEEKAECLFHLLVRRQLTTYLHTIMVWHLAEAMCNEIKATKPELFERIQALCGENLFAFVKHCSLLHDIGKTRITDIVNTQARRLEDREFEGILRHPAMGAAMIEKDADLMKYRDVALGHHKFYDGHGGYPPEFDNTKSPIKLVIDLITICDCIDAATDHLGRNYKQAKSLDEVLSEMREEKGTRYNPEFLEIIESSPDLKKKLDFIVSEGREDIMYHAYLEGMR